MTVRGNTLRKKRAKQAKKSIQSVNDILEGFFPRPILWVFRRVKFIGNNLVKIKIVAGYTGPVYVVRFLGMKIGEVRIK